MVVANAYGNLLSLSTASYWYSRKMNLTCSSLLTCRLSEGNTYRSRRAFADLALGRTELNPKHRIIFRWQEVFVRDWSLMIVFPGDVMLRPLQALAALKQLDTGRAMQLLQQVADSWLWWRSRLSWLQIPLWKAGFNAAAKTRLEAQVRFWDCNC